LNLLEITVGEYHYTFTENYQQRSTRSGESWRESWRRSWRDTSGDNLIYAMAQKINSLEEELSLSEKVFDEVNQSCFSYEEVLEKLKERNK